MDKGTRAIVVFVLLASFAALGASTLVNLATQVTGILPCASHPALTGNVTSSSGSCSTTVAAVPIALGGIGTSALTAGTTVSMNLSLGTVFTLTPAQTETINATNCTAGQQSTLIVTTSGTTSFTLTFSTNFRTTGTLATGTTTAKQFAISFMCNGSTATEISRTAAM
jgi:hypothetical protein